jgi:tetraacyldisaccharide 4'-kinase
LRGSCTSRSRRSRRSSGERRSPRHRRGATSRRASRRRKDCVAQISTLNTSIRFSDRLVAAWYAPSLTSLTLALTPFTALFVVLTSLRRALYRAGVLRTERVAVPVVVVGNITAGGSGKTPLVAALARALAERGFRPAIVSRGYGRRESGAQPLLVAPTSDPAAVGDEPLLLARAGWPVAVAADRAAAVRALLANEANCDVVLCDDGLQHYGLARDVEVAVVDGARGFGNGWRLPAGPLRERRARLADVDAVVVLDGAAAKLRDVHAPLYTMTLQPKHLRRVGAPGGERAIADFAGSRVHAVAGIGNPDRFFAQLAAFGLHIDAHPFPDHHAFVAADIAFEDAAPVVMTEKDAVKCEPFADDRCWYLPVEASIEPALAERIAEKLKWIRSSLKSSSARSPRDHSSTTAKSRS